MAALVAALGVISFAGHWLIEGRWLVRTNNAHVRADISEVATQVSGYVSQIHVEDNQAVKAGDLLVSIDDRDYQVAVKEAEAALGQAQADAAEAQSRIRVQAATIDWSRGQARASRDQVQEAQARREAASASAELSASDAARVRTLESKGAVARATLETAETARRTAEAQQTQAEAAVRAQQSAAASASTAIRRAQQELRATEAASVAAQARVAAMQARLDGARLNLERTRIRAPVDGVIANRAVNPGQLLSAGQTAMAVVPVSRAYVVANFKETQVAKMRPGQPVHINVDAFPELKLQGRIESLSPATGATFSLIPQDTATGNFTKIVQRVPVKITLDPDATASGVLRSGLLVEAVVNTRPARN